MMLKRRNFLQQTSLLSLTPLVPEFLTSTAAAAGAGKDSRILVVIELDGGNDGLNTVIPFADENYAKYRNVLRIKKKDIIALDDSLGLHPAMKPMSELYEDQRLAIVPGVGYPNPSRSHFESMAIWHASRLDSRDRNGYGWLGRACDQMRTPGQIMPDAVFVGGGTAPAAVTGRRTNTIVLDKAEELRLAGGLRVAGQPVEGDDIRAFVHRTLDASYTAAGQLADAAGVDSTGQKTYPGSGLGRRLGLVSQIIKMDGGTRVFYLSQGGYDTHAAQRSTHDNLLGQFSAALKAFLDDMDASGLGQRVLVMAFSEFGRRVQENASAGTDHGTAGPVFVAGRSVRPGLLADYPSLADLDDGDLKMTVDFRNVYASLLAQWLQSDSAGPLGSEFEPHSVVA